MFARRSATGCGSPTTKSCGCIIITPSGTGGSASRQTATRRLKIYDERFCRMWEFYLAAVELEFLHGSHMVFQLLLSNTRDAVPIRRDFMIDAERAELAK